MAYQSISTERAAPYFGKSPEPKGHDQAEVGILETPSASLYAQGAVPSGLFAFKLTASGAELNLGALDPNNYSGGVIYSPVTQQAYWQIAMGSANVGGSARVSNRQAIIDTGKQSVRSSLSKRGLLNAAAIRLLSTRNHPHLLQQRRWKGLLCGFP